jgi:DNA-binding XRE family transcriptional regulator
VISGAHVKAARAMLGLTTRELGKKAAVAVSTILTIEGTERVAESHRALGAIQAALESEGIEFILGVAPGVRLHPKNRRGK